MDSSLTDSEANVSIENANTPGKSARELLGRPGPLEPVVEVSVGIGTIRSVDRP